MKKVLFMIVILLTITLAGCSTKEKYKLCSYGVEGGSFTTEENVTVETKRNGDIELSWWNEEGQNTSYYFISADSEFNEKVVCELD